MSAENPVHGWARYCKHGCRCRVCCDAAVEYRYQRRLQSDRPSTNLGVPDWMDNAACKGKPAAVFFGPDLIGSGSNGKAWNTQQAKAICAGCDVRDECERFAIAENILHGIWGGRTPRERRPRYAEVPRSPKVYRHGTTTCYAHGCRCDDCRTANRNYKRDYQMRTVGPSRGPAQQRCDHCKAYLSRDGRCRNCARQETA